MVTEIIPVDELHIDEELLKRAGEIIRKGGLVAFPTETVYGLGGDALNPKSARRIYAAKGRPSDNPLIVHIADWEALAPIAARIPEAARQLADAFWPGPLTMIFKKTQKVPYETTGGLDTVAVRMPSNKAALVFIRAAGGYVAAPSANRSGRPSPTSARYVEEDLSGKVEMILDGGAAKIGLESTIVDLTEDVPVILRPGYITREMLEEVLRSVEMDQVILPDDSKQAPKAPGMKYRHYAPKGEMTVIAGGSEQVIAYINEQARLLRQQGHRVGVVASDETAESYEADIIKSVGGRNDEDSIAKRLYRILREFDDGGATVIFSESFGEKGFGQAIMNRLIKAAGYRTVHL